MSINIIVGYRTKPVPPEQYAPFMPEFAPDGRIAKDDAEKLAASVKAKQEAWLAEAKNSPYTGTFDKLTIIFPKTQEVLNWDAAGREPGAKKKPICVAVAAAILKRYPDAWGKGLDEKSDPDKRVWFIGFNMRDFLKIMGLECTLPENAFALPVRMWNANSEIRDIAEAVNPKEYKNDLMAVIKRRTPKDEVSAGKWAKQLAKWTGPGNDPAVDAWLATELASQLGFLE